MQEKKLVLPLHMLLWLAHQACSLSAIILLFLICCLQVAYHLADWIKSPMSEKRLVLPLHMAGGGLLKAVSKGIAKTATGATGAVGCCSCCCCCCA